MLCEHKGRFLFEVLPQYFPHGRLTHAESALWGMYFDDKQKNQDKAGNAAALKHG